MRLPPSWFLAPPLALAVLVGGCATAFPGPVAVDATSVAVVGVARRESVKGVNRSIAARDLVRRLEEGGRRRVVGPERVREAFGAASYDALLARYARTGLLDERDVRLLVRAPLDTRYALLVRVEQDDEIRLADEAAPRRDAGGRPSRDRVVIERAARRDVKLTALLVDRAGERVRVERRVYAASPVARVEGTEYRGSSFSGSVAALLANRLVNGGGASAAPSAPSRRATLEALFDEVERSLPRR